MKTASDAREEKAILSGEYAAYFRDLSNIRFDEAKREYLKTNPDVGVILRDGVEIWYLNLPPLNLGLTKEFTPESVL